MSEQLTDLQRRLTETRLENQRLRNLLKITHGVEPPQEQPAFAVHDPGIVTNSSPAGLKLALYARLFASRRDVYAKYWENARKGTKGWSPVTRDPFRKGSLWDRRPLPLTLEVVEAHLRVDDALFLGLYPLLPDATCWWLAADFDGARAMLDAHAYVKAAASLGVPCALEVSQSGRGAHVWTFFTEPVAASDARAMGTACIHRAMGLSGSMPLASYDRLFPNQDTVPTGSSGVGNLIAAPLNGQRRRDRGTTLFVDLATWEPWPDQWEFLSTLDRMTPRQAATVGRAERVLVGSEVTRLEASSATAIRPQPPVQIRATLGAQLTIQDEDLTPPLHAALRHAATIPNPAFYEAQRARRSTWNIPRFIQGFDITVDGNLVLPRGLRDRAEALLAQAGSILLCDDERQRGDELDIVFDGELTERQASAVDAMLAHDDGVLHAPTGSGKTVMACAIIAERRVSTLVLVDKKVLAEQWREQIRSLLGVKAGQLGGGRKKLTGRVDIALLPTLARRPVEEAQALTAAYGQVVVDECHHVAASSYEHSVGQIRAAWWLGLTATPPRRDGLEEITGWQLGPIRHVMRNAPTVNEVPTLLDEGPTRLLNLSETLFQSPPGFDVSEPGAMADLYGRLATDDSRNRQIASDIGAAVRAGRKCLVLTRRRDHVGLLVDLLQDCDPMTMQGGTSKKELAAIRGRIAEATPSDPLLIITTLPYAGEGFDAPIIDTVFLVAPISFPGLLVQAVGRALRAHEGKTNVVVHDYLDVAVPVLNAQYGKRRIGYRQLGFRTG